MLLSPTLFYFKINLFWFNSQQALEQKAGKWNEWQENGTGGRKMERVVGH